MKKTVIILLCCLKFKEPSISQANIDSFNKIIFEQIIGDWKFETHEMILAEHLKFYKEIPDFAKEKLEVFDGTKIDNQFDIRITKNNKFIINPNKHPEEYSFRIDRANMSIYRSDYIITLQFEINKTGELLLVDKKRVGESRIKLRKN